jgi:26S proteasome regulatory subunit N9
MLYLAYVSSDTLPAETRRDLAVDLSLAALLGDDSYDFAELIAHPIMTAIDDTAFAWLKSLVAAFNSGDMAAYDALCVKHAASLNAQPALVANERKLREKITILCLLQILFELPAECREISIADIAARTKLGVDGVEYLLMKALSVRLIEGVIDQVEGKVNVTWVTPRVLLKPQIKELSVRLDGWIEKVKSVGESLQEEIPTLATMA